MWGMYHVGQREGTEIRVDSCSHKGERTMAGTSVGWQEWRWREMS